MLTFNASLKTLLDSATTKLDWASKLQTALGNTRTLRCFRDSNSSATDPATSGTEFLRTSSTGALTVVSGNITSFGTISNVTIKLAADLSTGKSVLRIEGNGNYVQGTLGLTGSSADFVFSANPTGQSGVAFSKDAGMAAPVLMDSGTGPLSPPVDPSTDPKIVVYAVLEAYSGTTPTVIGELNLFGFREPNLVLEQPFMASVYGDYRRYRVADGACIKWGTGGDSYIVGGDILLGNKGMNDDADTTYQDVEIRMMPDTGQRWQNYPFKGGFNMATDTTVPPAFKIRLLNFNRQLVDVIEDYSTRDANNTPGSGWAVNDSRMYNEGEWFETNRPLQVSWNCRQTLGWKSHKPKLNPWAKHLMPDMVDDGIWNPINVAGFTADSDQWTLITDNYLGKGLGSYRVSPKWARGYNTGFDTTIIDTAFDQNVTRERYWITQATGYGYTPNGTGKHTWYNPPGGGRHDRSYYPDVMMRFNHAPTGNRVHGNVPWRELLDHWNMNYRNLAMHFWTDVAKGLSINKSAILTGDVCSNGGYYGGDDNYRLPRETKAIDVWAATASQHGRDLFKRDKNGKLFVSEQSRDSMHNQSNYAKAAIFTIDPRAVINAMHSFSANILCNYDNTRGVDPKNYTGRAHAWYFGHFVDMWIVANNHPNCPTAKEVERMCADYHLNFVHDTIRPHWDSPTSFLGACLRKFGVKWDEQAVGDGTYRLMTPAEADFPNSKAFYFAQPFVLAKQSGFYDAIRAYSPKCQWAIDNIMECLNINATGVLVDAEGRFDCWQYHRWWQCPTYPTGGAANILNGWGALYPPRGVEDWITFEDGSYFKDDAEGGIDNCNTKHFRAQWVWAMDTFFKEKEIPKLAQAKENLARWYAKAETKPGGQYWSNRFANMGRIGAPDYVGPPIN